MLVRSCIYLSGIPLSIWTWISCFRMKLSPILRTLIYYMLQCGSIRLLDTIFASFRYNDHYLPCTFSRTNNLWKTYILWNFLLLSHSMRPDHQAISFGKFCKLFPQLRSGIQVIGKLPAHNRSFFFRQTKIKAKTPPLLKLANDCIRKIAIKELCCQNQVRPIFLPLCQA